MEEEDPEHSLFKFMAKVGHEDDSEITDETVNEDDKAVNEIEEQILVVEGFSVDDDNHPAPKNIPAHEENEGSEQPRSVNFGWNGICYRRRDGNGESRAILTQLRGVALEGVSMMPSWWSLLRSSKPSWERLRWRSATFLVLPRLSLVKTNKFSLDELFIWQCTSFRQGACCSKGLGSGRYQKQRPPQRKIK